MKKQMEENAIKALENARKEVEEAVLAEFEAAAALQEAERKAENVGLEDRIQKLVDERQQAKKERNFDKADRLEEELRGMGVHENRTDFTWSGPNGMKGSLIQRRPGDWECPSCSTLCFASKDRCFKCGTRKDGSGGGGGGRRSPSYDRGGGRRGDKSGRDRGGRRRHESSDSY